MIVVFKLISSETIISEVLYEDSEYFLIKSPLKVEVKYDRNRGLKMMTESRWCHFNDDEIMLLTKKGILGFSLVSKEHAKIYKDAVEYYEKDDQVEEELSEEELDMNDPMINNLNPLKNTIH